MGVDPFLDFMQKSLQHRHESNIDIEIFKLCVIDHDGKSDKRIDESICFAIEHNVRVGSSIWRLLDTFPL